MQRLRSKTSQIRNFLIAISFIFLCSCASKMDIIQVGPWSEKRSVEDVKYFISRKQIKKPWGAVAIIHGSKFNPGDREGIKGDIKRARKMAADIGADAVVLTETSVPTGNSFNEETKVFITGIAIKYTANVSTESKK